MTSLFRLRVNQTDFKQKLSVTIVSRILTKQGFRAGSSNIMIIIVNFNYVSMVVNGPLGLKTDCFNKSKLTFFKVAFEIPDIAD